MIKKISKYCNSNYPFQIAKYAARIGNIDMVEWAITTWKFSDSIIASAAKGNQIDTIKWLMNRGHKITYAVIHRAAKKGFIDTFKFLIEQDYMIALAGQEELQLTMNPLSQANHIGYVAALSGQNDIIQFLHSYYPKLLSGIDEGAIKIGNFDLFKFAVDNGYAENIKQKIENNICGPYNDIKILQWLFTNNCLNLDSKISTDAIYYGNLECLQFLYSKGYLILDEKLFEIAAQNCDIATINFLHYLNCPISKRMIFFFVTGFLNQQKYKSKRILTRIEFWDTIKLLEEWDCEWGDISYLIARSGDLEILKYAYDHGCPLDNVIENAARGGYLHIIIWARERGCVWDVSTCDYCVAGGHIDLLKWLRNHDNYRATCSLPSNETEICPWDANVCRIAHEKKRFDILKFALDNGCPNYIKQ